MTACGPPNLLLLAQPVLKAVALMSVYSIRPYYSAGGCKSDSPRYPCDPSSILRPESRALSEGLPDVKSTTSTPAAAVSTRASMSRADSRPLYLFGSGVGDGMSRNEEGAAVLVRDDGDGICANAPGLADDLLLVHSYQRAEHWKLQHAPHSRQVLQGLGSHLPQAFARNKGLGSVLTGQPLGDSRHEPPVDHHPVRGRD